MQIKNIKIYQNGEWQLYTLQTVDNLENIVSDLQPRMTDAEDRLFSLEQTDKTHGSNITTNTNNINTLSQNLSTLEGKVTTHTTEISGMKGSVEQAADNAMTANTRLDSLEPRMTDAEDRLSSLENSDVKMGLIEDAFSVYTEDLTASSAVNKLTLYEIGYNQSGYKTTIDAEGKFLKEDLYSYTSYELQLPNKSGTLATLDDVVGGGGGGTIPSNTVLIGSDYTLTKKDGKTINNIQLKNRVGAYAYSNMSLQTSDSYTNTGKIKHTYYLPDLESISNYNEVKVTNSLPKVSGELGVRPTVYKAYPSTLSIGSEWTYCSLSQHAFSSSYYNAEIFQLQLSTDTFNTQFNHITVGIPAKELYRSYYEYLAQGSDINRVTPLIASFASNNTDDQAVKIVVTNISTSNFNPFYEDGAYKYDTSEANDIGKVIFDITFAIKTVTDGYSYVSSVDPVLVCTGASEEAFEIDPDYATY